MGQHLSRLWLEEADSYVHDLYNLPPQRELRKPHQDPRFYPCVGPQGYPGLRNADVSETADLGIHFFQKSSGTSIKLHAIESG